MLYTSIFGSSAWFGSHANVAHCAIRPPGHNGTLPPKSARSYSHAPSGEGFDPSYHPPLLVWPPPGDYRSELVGPGLWNS